MNQKNSDDRSTSTVMRDVDVVIWPRAVEVEDENVVQAAKVAELERLGVENGA